MSEQRTQTPRVQSIDVLRGCVMVLMAIDHLRDYLNRSAMFFSPTDLGHTAPPIFFTRWITHFCAPGFFLTAGMGVRLWLNRSGRAKAFLLKVCPAPTMFAPFSFERKRHSMIYERPQYQEKCTKKELSKYLLLRGALLLILEVTVLRWIMFSWFSASQHPILLFILSALGLSMMALAVLIYLPAPVLLALSLCLICLHNLLDPVRAGQLGSLGWVWDILHQQNAFRAFGITFVTAYPILPWIGVMLLGYLLGGTYGWDVRKRRKLLLYAGSGAAVTFLIIRTINGYGDPEPWRHFQTASFTAMSFLNVTKYPPSLDFLLMTLGPEVILLALFEQMVFARKNPLVVFGRTPLFYYVLHIALAHLFCIVLGLVRYGVKAFVFTTPPSMGGNRTLFPANFGFPLWVVYASWALMLFLLYPACRWYAGLKQRGDHPLLRYF